MSGEPILSSSIWEEIPSAENPYLAQQCRCHGYDLQELMRKRSYVEVLHLLFRGELPDKNEAELLETLMIGLINPGPRHPAARAAINAGNGRSSVEHVLPVSLAVMGGQYGGAVEVSAAMLFLKENCRKNPRRVIDERLHLLNKKDDGHRRIAPGFGSRFGGRDPLAQQLACCLGQLQGKGACLNWGKEFAGSLLPQEMGWLASGVAAAVLCDLGFSQWAGAGLFQLMCAPGLLAHGVEAGKKKPTTYPSLFDEKAYVISRNEGENGCEP